MRFLLLAAVAAASCCAAPLYTINDFWSGTQTGEVLVDVDYTITYDLSGLSFTCALRYSGIGCPSDMLMPEEEVEQRQLWIVDALLDDGQITLPWMPPPPPRNVAPQTIAFAYALLGDVLPDTAGTPEPASAGLAGVGLLAILYARRAHLVNRARKLADDHRVDRCRPGL